MLEKLNNFYFFMIMLNSAVKFNEGADYNKSNKLLNKSSIRVNEATNVWQPIIQSRYWLLTPTKSTTALSGATELLSTKVIEKRNFSVNITGNYDKKFTKPLKSTAKLTAQILPPPTRLDSDMKLESQFHPLNKENSNSYQHQLLSLNYNTGETQYPRIQKSQNVMQQEQKYPKLPPFSHQNVNNSSSMLSRLSNFNYLIDKQLTNSSSFPILSKHYTTQAKHTPTLKTNSINTSNTNFSVKISDTNKEHIENILPTALNSLSTNKDLIDNIKQRRHQYPNNKTKINIDIKSLKIGDKKAIKATQIATADRNYGNKEKFLKNILYNIEGFDNFIKAENSSKSYQLSDYNDAGKQNDAAVSLNEDATYDDFDLEKFILKAQQLVKVTSISFLTAIATSLKKLQSFDMKNIFHSASGVPFSARASFLSFLHDGNVKANETGAVKFHSTSNGTDVMSQIRNLSTKDETIFLKATTPTFSLPVTTTSKSPIVVSSGRKLKKVKKKFQQILLPLLLAYKLKFLALIPLLAGGLILLVGSTGLAGFFFALFTAVMSLKTDHGNAIVVKKY